LTFWVKLPFVGEPGVASSAKLAINYLRLNLQGIAEVLFAEKNGVSKETLNIINQGACGNGLRISKHLLF
jgi:3-hydroxyisobutyrate dehydrogenase-like beta-hydroxyacid dehydrogenase